MPSLLLLDGSPRGPRSNSMKMLARLAEGWEQAGGAPPQVLHLARRLALAGSTLLVSLHDLRTALCFDRVLVLDQGSLVGYGPPEQVLTPELIQAVFQVRALKAEAMVLELPG